MIGTLKLRTHDILDDNDDVNSLVGVNKKMDRFIVMDDVSGVADISSEFAILINRKMIYFTMFL